MKKRLAIHSVPRSGSTWLGEIYNSHPEVIYKYQPLFSYAFKDRLTPNSTKDEIEDFFKDIAIAKDSFLDQIEAREQGKLPVFRDKDKANITVYKEVRYHHILKNALEKDKGLKVIGLVRNPLSVINSWLTAPREFRKDLGWNAEEEWRFAPKKNLNNIEEYYGYEKWKEVAYLFLMLEKEFSDQFKIVTYDNLISKTEKTVKDIFSFCSLSYTVSTKQFISISKANNNPDTYSVFKIKKTDDNWVKSLPKSIIDDIIEDLKNTTLEKFI